MSALSIVEYKYKRLFIAFDLCYGFQNQNIFFLLLFSFTRLLPHKHNISVVDNARYN